jgi:hypothetical protein
MRTVLALAALGIIVVASQSRAQECLRPEWTHCEEFPSGGRHTGVDNYKNKLEVDIPANSKICVVYHEEIGGDTFAHFELNGVRWPNKDWMANVDTFCLFRK